jgi:DNA-binding NarL/FixJ family response regulator
MSKIRVVIVDDHAIVRRGLTDLLGVTDDLEVVGEAGDGVEALVVIARERPNVVLMDVSMPDMDGVEATKQIRARFPDTHIVILTSFSDHATISSALDAGATGFLLKHAAPDEILSGIRVAMSGGSPLDPTVARKILDHRTAPAPIEVSAQAGGMTAREREVLGAVRRGMANKQIARELNISERTVKAHLTSIFQRLGVTDRTQAALWARDHLA